MSSSHSDDPTGSRPPPSLIERLHRMLREERPDFAAPSAEECLAFLEGTATETERERVLEAIEASPLFAEEILALRDDLHHVPAVESGVPAKKRGLLSHPSFRAAAALAAGLLVFYLVLPIGSWEFTKIETPIMVRGSAGPTVVVDAGGKVGLHIPLSRPSGAELLIVLMSAKGGEVEVIRQRSRLAERSEDPAVEYFPRPDGLERNKRFTVTITELSKTGVRGELLGECSFTAERRWW